MYFKNIGITLSLCLLVSTTYAQERINIGQFSKQNLSDWNEKEFNDLTIYNLVKEDDSSILKAHSIKSASGLFKEQAINISEYPFLNWRWKTTTRLNVSNEKTKSGDDFSARIYIIKDGGLFFWNTKALNYVWARHEKKDAVWPNAYAPNNAMMIAVRSENDALNTWYDEKRNLAKDYEQAFGERIDEIDGIAIMADTDDSQDETVSYFGDIYFTKN